MNATANRTANLTAHNYGKQRVRVFKILDSLAGGERQDGGREGSRRWQEVKELEVGVRLEGDFAAALTAGDNAHVVATDTMKNTVQVLAHRHLGSATEPFAMLVARHFLDQSAHVDRVTVETSERSWRRMAFDGREHPHSFTAEPHTPVVRVVDSRGAARRVDSGVRGLLVLKSTGSGFSGFPRDAYTTLPETDDRILSTLIDARWRWSEVPEDPSPQNAAILEAMLRVFAERFSPSVQATIWEMAEAAFEVCGLIDEITLALPNKHFLPANLKPFGIDAAGVSFVPTDEPHGQIEATIARAR
jgi:urate oxidase